MEVWLILCFMVALSTLLTVWFRKRSGGKKLQPPPGPWTLPIMGSLHHLVSVHELPHRRMMRLSHRHGPLMLLRLGEVPAVVVSDAEAAALVLKANDLAFADRPRSTTLDVVGSGGKGIVFAPYSDKWREMRKTCTLELLSSKQVRRMEAIRADEVANLLRSITVAAAPVVVNVSKVVTALSNNVVARAIFSGKFREQEEYLRELDKAFPLAAGFCLVDLFPSSRLVRWFTNGERLTKSCCGRMHRIIADVIEERKDIIAAATDTTASVVEWAMSELMKNPATMDKAQREIREVLGEGRDVITNSDLAHLHYMRMVIKEALRLHPAVPLVPRKAREDCKIMGYDILKGTNVYINLYAVSRDPIFWENPEEFNPERFKVDNGMDNNDTYLKFIPFGHGRRKCPGIQFSSAVMEIALANILYHFDWMLPDGVNLASFDMSEKFGLTISRRNDLQLKVVPRL